MLQSSGCRVYGLWIRLVIAQWGSFLEPIGRNSLYRIAFNSGITPYKWKPRLECTRPLSGSYSYTGWVVVHARCQPVLLAVKVSPSPNREGETIAVQRFSPITQRRGVVGLLVIVIKIWIPITASSWMKRGANSFTHITTNMETTFIPMKQRAAYCAPAQTYASVPTGVPRS